MNCNGLLNLIRRGGIIAVTATTLITAGCGGGGGDDASSGSATTTPPPAAGANKAPTISGTPAAQVNVGTAYTVTPVAADADGDTLAFSVQNLPPWAQFSTATGQLTGTPGQAHIGTFANVTISVSDGNASAAMPAFSITVAAAGTPPVVTPPPTTTPPAGTPPPTTTPPAGTPPPTTTPPVGTPPPTTGTPGVNKGAATLQWNIPTETVEKTALQDLAGYRVHYGKAEGMLTNSVDVPNPSVSTFVVDKLTPGTWYFTVTSVNSGGHSSAQSKVLKLVVT